MKFTLLSLVTGAALVVSAGSVSAQPRMHGGFSPPMGMNMRPNFNTSPFMMNTNPTFVHPRFNIASGAHPNFSNSVLLNPRFNIAPGASPSFSNSVVINPRVNTLSPFHQNMVFNPSNNFRTNGLLTPAQRGTVFIPPTFGSTAFGPTFISPRFFPTNGVALPFAGQVQLAQLGLAPFGTGFIPTGGFGTLPFAGQVQLAQLRLGMPFGLSPFNLGFGTPGLNSGFSFWSGGGFTMPGLLW
jgi:hypothetical protein